MHRRVQAFITEELGIIDMDISKPELIELLQRNNIKYRETPRTITLKNRDRTNMMYIIFSDLLDKIIMVDLCNTELQSLVIDDETYSTEFIRQLLDWKHIMKCEFSGKKVQLDKNLNAVCSEGLQCRMCLKAGLIKHEASLQDSIITYYDFGDFLDNKTFCIENNNGNTVNFRRIRKEDVMAMKNKI